MSEDEVATMTTPLARAVDVGGEEILLPLDDLRGLLAELRREALLRRGGEPLRHGAAQLERLIESDEEGPVPLREAEAADLLPALEALRLEQLLPPALERLRVALARVA